MIILFMGAIVTGLLMLVHFFAPGRIELEHVFAPIIIAISLIIISWVINQIRAVIFHFKAKRIKKMFDKTHKAFNNLDENIIKARNSVDKHLGD